MTEYEYNKCVEVYSDKVYRFALKSLRESDAAKDVVQESFLRLWVNRAEVLSGKEKSYLFTIAYRLIIDRVREEKRFQNGEVPFHRYGGVQQSDQEPDVGEWVFRLLDRLPEQQKTLVLLRDYEGYSYRELAEMTALSEAQVKVYLYRARLALKNSLKDIHLIL